MTNEELQQQWAAFDNKLDEQVRLNREMFKTIQADRMRSAARRITTYEGLECAVNFLAVIWLGNFIFNNWGAPRFSFPAMVLDVFFIAIIAAQIRQIVASMAIDYSGPVAAIQTQIERVRMQKIRRLQAIFLLATLAWTPLLIVSLKAFFDIDAWGALGAGYLAVNAVFGLAMIPLGIWLAKRFGERTGFLRHMAGKTLDEARAFLANVADFTREPV